MFFYVNSSEKESVYIELCDAVRKNNEVDFINHRPITKSLMKKLVYSSMYDDNARINIGIIPHFVLHYITRYKISNLVWYRPTMIKKILFDKVTHLESGLFSVPPLIFMVNEESMYVVAYKEKTRPMANTELFMAPFFNVSFNGRICLGNTPKSKKQNNIYDTIVEWETYFWGSVFTHQSSKPIEGNYNLYAKRYVGQTNKSFPMKRLISLKCTLAEFINKTQT